MIPTKFSLVDRDWVVLQCTSKEFQQHIDDNPLLEGYEAKGLLGLCDQKANLILINTDMHVSEWELENTFWHEFTHALLFGDGQDEHDEAAVDRFGSMLHQFERTKKPGD